MTMDTQRRAPVDLPSPFGNNNIEREPLWYAFATGDDEPPVPPWVWATEPPMTAHVHPPAPEVVCDGARTALPLGTTELLEAAPYPKGRPARVAHGRVAGTDDRLGHALTAAFGVQWFDPDNAYNPHRGYASPRCLYPVQAFLRSAGRWRLLAPELHSLIDLDVPPSDRSGTSAEHRLALLGRYTRIPRGYKWFRGSLVNLELGFVLRSLALGLELFGLTGHVRLPGANAVHLLAELGLEPAGDWSLPLIVDVGEGADGPDPVPAVRRAGAAPGARRKNAMPGVPSADASLVELVRVNRAQSFAEPPAELGPAAPPGARPSAKAASWAELIWQRNSGRMPRGLLGMSGRRRQVQADTLHDAIDWLGVPPPGATLRAVFDAIDVTVVVQAVDGYPDGIYRIRDGRAVLWTEDPRTAARIEQEYGYPLSPGAGCDIRHASTLWFLSVRPRELVDAFGPAGWSALQYVCGWAMHGLCLSSTASGMFARPVRAFNEIPLQALLGLGTDHMIALAAVVGTPRHPTGALLDIRL
ncbi:hypothetical protein [Streptomyces sp. NPDC014734]|uniref:hypothetical protein n=1 Tax=Streptomyces sp. NPDC014734 TaxID=3364886 RepID=UPI0036FCD2B9